jgi:hypothetical protein
MAESDFSWLKMASFFGALVLVILAIVTIANGILLITGGDVMRGVASIVGGLVCAAGAVIVYLNYQRKSDESRYGKK